MPLSRLLAFLRRLRASDQADRELHDDVQAYADMLADDLETRGLSRAEAERRARASLGGIEPVKEGVRGIRAGAWLEQGWRDVSVAWRGLRRAPAFTLAAVLTIGLGLGVTTTIFSVIDSAVFKPLPYDRPEELVQIGHRLRIGTAMEHTVIGMTWQEATAWAEADGLMEDAAAFTFGQERRWLERDMPLRVGAMTSNMPAMLGLRPIAGRMITDAEAADAARAIVIAEPLWTSAFGRRADVIGQTMTLDGSTWSIVGVLPSDFRFGPAGGGRLMAWTGLSSRPAAAQPAQHLFRLRAGITPAEAQDRADAVAAGLQAAAPTADPWAPQLFPLDRARSDMGDRLQAPMLMLFGTAGLVLLIACVNVAHLLVSRGAARRSEMALRAALGAGRARLARLLLAEGISVAVLGGIAAVLLAAWTSGTLAALMPSRLRSGLFIVSAPAVDWRALAFALSATLAVVVISAVWPALSCSRVSLTAASGHAGRVHGGRRRASRWLQAVQVALAFVLAVTTALLGRSFVSMLDTDLGFDARELGVVAISLSEDRYDSPEARALALDEIVARIRATPGVRSAALGDSPAATTAGRMVLAGGTDPVASVAIRTVGHGYLDTAGIRLLSGRDFGPDDTASSPHVALIDEAGARRVFGGESPIGRRFSYSAYSPEFTIVGVVPPVAGVDFADREPDVGVFLAGAQTTPPSSVLVRAERELPDALAAARQTISAFDPGVVIESAVPAIDYYETMETYAAPRFYLALVSTFAVLALATTSIGLYGMLAHAIGRRRREIGVRVSLGATPARIRYLVLAEALVPVGLGLLLGGVAASWTSGLIESQLYAVGPGDPIAFALAAAALVLTALVAAIGPLRRANGVDPIAELRVQ